MLTRTSYHRFGASSSYDGTFALDLLLAVSSSTTLEVSHQPRQSTFDQ
ncbi:MAG: hypothetical protein L6Q35_13620 [Phycisphaerales bacterium]|nr:hypothetical protein [Phycisphaerales bacterium]